MPSPTPSLASSRHIHTHATHHSNTHTAHKHTQTQTYITSYHSHTHIRTRGAPYRSGTHARTPLGQVPRDAHTSGALDRKLARRPQRSHSETEHVQISMLHNSPPPEKPTPLPQTPRHAAASPDPQERPGARERGASREACHSTFEGLYQYLWGEGGIGAAFERQGSREATP